MATKNRIVGTTIKEQLKCVRAWVADIARAGASGDHEVAHSMEDQLFQDALERIARGPAPDPEALAREALKSLNLSFERRMS
jgi:hypothetical protein